MVEQREAAVQGEGARAAGDAEAIALRVQQIVREAAVPVGRRACRCALLAVVAAALAVAATLLATRWEW